MTRETLDATQAGIDALVTEKFGLKSGALSEKLRRAAPRMPRGAKQAVVEDLDYLEKARKRTAHPKRRGQIDRDRIASMVAGHEKRLSKVDPSRDRARARLNWLGGLAFNLILFGVVYFALLKWLGAI